VNTLAWQWKSFAELSGAEVYSMLALRASVFVVEQTCPYPDADGLDFDARHLFVHTPDEKLCAYLRLLTPGVRFATPSIGRVVVSPEYRGAGLGRRLMQAGMQECRRLWPAAGMSVGAQAHLEPFYQSLGFRTLGAPYDEDGIPHIDMCCAA